MPTAPKLVAALAFGASGYALYLLMLDFIGDDVVPPYLLAICVISGVVLGWRLCGRHASNLITGIGHGYTAVVAQVLAIVFIISITRMFKLAWRMRYDEPVETAMDGINMMVGNLVTFATPEILGLLGVGGLVSGALTGLAAQLSKRK